MIDDENSRAVSYYVRSAIHSLGWHSRIGDMSIDNALKSLAKAQEWLCKAKSAVKDND